MKQPSCIPTSQRKFDARYEPASVKWLKHSISFLIITIDIRTIEGEEQCTASTAEEDVITVPQNKLRASGKLQYEIRKGADHLPNYVLHVCSNALWDACGLFDVVNQINRTTHVHTVSSQFRAIFGWSHMVYFLARVGTHWSLSDIWRPFQFSRQHWRQRSKHIGDKTILQAASFRKELTRD